MSSATSQLPVFDLHMLRGTVLVNNTRVIEKVPINKFPLDKHTNKLKTSFRGFPAEISFS